MQGQIVKIVSDLHYVSYLGETYPCKCRGIFRKEHITPVVGDYVLFSKEKYLIETRCSGALTIPYSAIAIDFVADTNTVAPAADEVTEG